MKLYRPGTRVLLAGEIPGAINQVCIAGEKLHVTYEIEWWDKHTRHAAWFQPHAFTADVGTRGQVIGFHDQGVTADTTS